MPDMEAELREIRRSYSNICKEIQTAFSYVIIECGI